MLDIHTHILPNIDDGSKSFDESIDMIKYSLVNGVDTIVFTPHTRLGKHISKSEIIDTFNSFKVKLDELNLPIKYYLGSELHYTKNTLTRIDNNDYIAINNSKYILVEFEYSDTFETISEVCYNLSLKDLKVIIAHVERYNLSTDDIIKLKHEGNLIQCNQEFFKLKNRVTYKKLLKANAIDYIASDCHNMVSRKPGLMRVSKIIEKYNLNKDLFE